MYAAPSLIASTPQENLVRLGIDEALQDCDIVVDLEEWR